MLRWCSYCQQFIGETAPFEHLVVTHGLCAACEQTVLDLSDSDIELARTLKKIQDQLYDAGRRSDLQAAARIIEASGEAHLRAVDIMIGIIAPLLYTIGEDWKRGAISMAEEFRFTSFCEKTFELVASKIRSEIPPDATLRQPRAEILLLNAPGNRHTLAIRILALWLLGGGVQAQALDWRLDTEALILQVRKFQPGLVLISVALAEQADGVAAIVERIAAFPEPVRPRVIVGGYAVKQGLILEFPGAELFADISQVPLAAIGQKLGQ